MIDPLRLHPLQTSTKYQQMKKIPKCFICSLPSVYTCQDCNSKMYCQSCFLTEHSSIRKRGHKKKRMVVGQPVVTTLLRAGDGSTFPKAFVWVKVQYKVMCKPKMSSSSSSSAASSSKFNKLLQSKKSKEEEMLYGPIIDTNIPPTSYSPFKFLSTSTALKYQSNTSGPSIHLQIIKCDNLAAINKNNLSDPYVAIWWKDVFVGTTRVIVNNLNPTWENESFVVPLDKTLIGQLEECYGSRFLNGVDKKNKSNDTNGNGDKEKKYRQGDMLSPSDAIATVHEVTGSSELSKISKLRLDIFDYNSHRKNVFIGQVNLCDNDLLKVIVEGDDWGVRDFKLTPKRARGVLGVKVMLDVKKGKLVLQICDGKNLIKADPFNLSDPYCVIFFNDAKIGKTKTIKNTLNPEWNNAYFDIKLDPNESTALSMIDIGVLRIEIHDWDRFGSDDPLGELTFNGPELRTLVELSKNTMLLGLDDTVLTIIEDEFRRLEGTPFENDFTINLICKIDEEKEEERRKIKFENERINAEALKEKIFSGLETKEEARVRKIAEKEKRREDRETKFAAKQLLKKELKKRGMLNRFRKSRDSRVSQSDSSMGSMASSRNESGRESNAPSIANAYSMNAILKAAKAEALKESDGMLTGRSRMEDDVENGLMTGRSDLMTGRSDRSTTDGGRKKSIGSNSKIQLPPKKKGMLLSELSDERIGELADDPDTILDAIKSGEIKMKRKAGEASEIEGNRYDEDDDNDDDDDDNSDEEEEEEEIEDGYEYGTCTAYSETLGIKIAFQDFDGINVVQREHWMPLSQVPLNVKIGDNPNLNALWRKLELDSIPLWTRIWKGDVKINAELDHKKKKEKSWLSQIVSGKNLGLKTYYPLFLPASESGAEKVKGNIGLRLIYHTKGTVLRGVDEAVQTMTLGEKILVKIREDYAFGETWGDFLIPPNSELTVELELVGVGKKGAFYLLLRRKINSILRNSWLILQAVIWVWETMTLHKLLCPKWCKTNARQKQLAREDSIESFDVSLDEEGAPKLLVIENENDDDSISKMEEGAADAGGGGAVDDDEEEEERKDPAVVEAVRNKSTLGARLMFSKF